MAFAQSKNRPAPAPRPLAAAVKTALTMASRDETRFHLTGVLLEAKGGILRAIATDGHRMAVISMPRDRAIPADYYCVLTRLGAELVARGAMPTALRPESRIATQYPPWEAVVPVLPGKRSAHRYGNSAAFTATVSRRALLALCKTAAAEVKSHAELDERGRRVRSDRGVEIRVAGGELALHASTPVWEGEVGRVPLGVARGTTLRLGIHLRYLDDALRAIDAPTVRIGFGDPLSPVRFDDGTAHPTALVVVMPMRI